MPRRICCDPYKRHKKQIARSLEKPSQYLIECVNDPRVNADEMLCTSCRIRLTKDPRSLPVLENSSNSSVVQGSESSQSNSGSMLSIGSSPSEAEISRQDTEAVMPVLGVSPLASAKGLSEKRKRLVGTRKLKTAARSLKRKFEQTLSVDLPTPEATPTKQRRQAKDSDMLRYEEIMEELRIAFQNSNNYRRRLSILTLSPYRQKRTAEFFGTTLHMVKRSRHLKQTHGILPEVQPTSKGRRISPDEQTKVKAFYESDEVSRMCPGKKDCLTVRDENGLKIKAQKRLMLGNLRELYNLYKADDNNPKLGFSTFAALRPKQCVLAGSSGTHSVCICTYHQNPTLLISALDLPGLTVDDLLDHAVCCVDNRDCMMQCCDDCPGEEGVLTFLRLLVSEGAGEDDDDDGGDDEIRYKQWISTDRCALKDVIESRDECLNSLSRQIAELTKHHYRAKAQSAYFACLKERVGAGEVVVHGDFSENYSFIVQDAAQGFHWDTSQCTVHPFVVYWREGEAGTVCHQSYCCISDGTKHNTAMVHTFLRRLMPEIRTKVSNLKKVHYFTDGCAAQYKNKYNFANVCHHEEDFGGVSCEWHFFATSHGKGACDGIGGSAKRATYHESLKRPLSDQILTAEGMFEFLSNKFVSVIQFIYVPVEEVAKVENDLSGRFSRAVTVKGTKQFHRFSPISIQNVVVRELSADHDGRKVKVCK